MTLGNNNHDDLNIKLQDAVYKQDINRFKELLDLGAEVGYKSKDEVNVLHIAAYVGNEEIVDLILRKDPSIIDLVMSGGATALFIASKLNRQEIVKLLIDNGANLDLGLQDNAVNPLSVAIAQKNIEITKLLIDNGANFYTNHLIGALEYLYHSSKANSDFILNKHFEKLKERNALAYECSEIAESKEREVVIVRYNEDLSWVPIELPCIDITVYNKGPSKLKNSSNNISIKAVPNVGFYDGTILKHIVDNYYNLKEKTLFIQAFPYDGYLFLPIERYFDMDESSCHNIIAKCQYANLEVESLTLQKTDFSKGSYNLFNYQNNNLTAFAHHYLDTEIPEMTPMIWNSQFLVTKENVYRHPIQYYKKLLSSIDYTRFPFEAFYFKRLWDLVFAKPSNLISGECANYPIDYAAIFD